MNDRVDHRKAEPALYWKSRVCLTNRDFLEQDKYLYPNALRHQATNYDELLQSQEFKDLEETEQETAYWIIRYECNTLALQERSEIREERINRLEKTYQFYNEKLQELQSKREEDRTLIVRLTDLLGITDKRVRELEEENKIYQADASAEKSRRQVAEQKNIRLQEELDQALSAKAAAQATSYKMRGKAGGLAASKNRIKLRVEELEALAEQREARIKQLESENNQD